MTTGTPLSREGVETLRDLYQQLHRAGHLGPQYMAANRQLVALIRHNAGPIIDVLSAHVGLPPLAPLEQNMVTELKDYEGDRKSAKATDGPQEAS